MIQSAQLVSFGVFFRTAAVPPLIVMPSGIPLALLALLLLHPSVLLAQSLRGSRASVERMYQHAVRNGLHFYESGEGVREGMRDGVLVRMSGNADYRLGDVSYAYVLPSTRSFVQRISADYRATCGERLVVTSGMRPRSMKLRNSVDRSVHPTGMAVDLRKPNRPRCLNWLRSTLMRMERDGLVEATEEHRPPHFHVAVFSQRSRPAAPAVAARTTRPAPSPAPGKSPGRAAASSAKSSDRTSAGSASGTVTHRVRSGESIWLIARRNGVGVEEIRKANHLTSSHIVPGQVLRIPKER